MAEFVFIVSWDCVVDCTTTANGSKVFAKKENALDFYNTMVQEEKPCIPNAYIIEEINFDSDNYCTFEAYEDGYYTQNHTYVSLLKKEVN